MEEPVKAVRIEVEINHLSVQTGPVIMGGLYKVVKHYVNFLIILNESNQIIIIPLLQGMPDSNSSNK